MLPKRRQEWSRPTWAEVDLNKIAANIGAFRRLLPANVKIMAVVKANAYGHGANEVGRIALAAGASMLGVASLEEGISLRGSGINAPVLIFGYTDPKQAPLLVEQGITPTLFDWDGALQMSRHACACGSSLGFHFKVDTGMGRLGLFDMCDALLLLEKVSNLPGLRLDGVYTHFAAADEEKKAFTQRQLDLFRKFLENARRRGMHIPLRHAANTAATIEYPEASFDMVRVGIGIYGYYPSPTVNRQKISLQPALSLKSRIIFIKRVAAGTPVSYGYQYCAPRETLIATVPLGYGDGLNRLLSKTGSMLVRGQRVPVAGRICMDLTMLDVGMLPEVREGDEAVAYGRQSNEEISVDEVAAQLGTISYEVLCSISARVPRIYHLPPVS